MRRPYHGRNALIERWNKYHPINCELAHHIDALEQQGECIRGTWIPQAELEVIALCGWAVRNADIETRWWAADSDGGGMWLSINEHYIDVMRERWHPRTVMDFFKYWYSEEVLLEDERTYLVDDLKEATDPLHATQLVFEVLSLNLSNFLYKHFIEDKASDSYTD